MESVLLLPNEIIQEVIRFCRPVVIVELIKLNKRLSLLCDDLWEFLVEKHFGSSDVNTIVKSQTVKEFYPRVMVTKKELFIRYHSIDRFKNEPDLGYKNVDVEVLGGYPGLCLSKKDIKVLSPLIGVLTNLKILDLTYNNIIKLPDSIGRLINLTEINLDNNHLKHLPESFVNLKCLKKIALNNNDFAEIPKEIITMIENNQIMEVFLLGNPVNLGKEASRLPKLGTYFRDHVVQRKCAIVRA